MVRMVIRMRMLWKRVTGEDSVDTNGPDVGIDEDAVDEDEVDRRSECDKDEHGLGCGARQSGYKRSDGGIGKNGVDEKVWAKAQWIRQVWMVVLIRMEWMRKCR